MAPYSLTSHYSGKGRGKEGGGGGGLWHARLLESEQQQRQREQGQQRQPAQQQWQGGGARPAGTGGGQWPRWRDMQEEAPTPWRKQQWQASWEEIKEGAARRRTWQEAHRGGASPSTSWWQT